MMKSDNWVYVVVALCLMLFIAPLTFIVSLHHYARPRQLSNVAQITHLTRLYFPPTSTLIEGTERRSWSPSIVAKITMEKKDLKKFMAQKVIADKLIDEGCGFTGREFPSDETQNWNFKSLQNKPCLSGANRPAETGGFWMIIDERKQDALIYLYYQN